MKVIIKKSGHGNIKPNKEGTPVEMDDAQAFKLIQCGVAVAFVEEKPTKKSKPAPEENKSFSGSDENK